MNFSNQNILPGELPTIADAVFHSLEKDYLKVERISFFITLGIFCSVAGALFYFIEALREPVIILVLLALFTLSFAFYYVSLRLSFKYSGYALRERDALYKSGWLTQKTRVVMLNRIQHVSVQSGPIERRFGLSSVSIYTAGASEADFTIKGISTQTAQNIKDWISTKLNGTVNPST